jgi:hypothetical protein
LCNCFDFGDAHTLIFTEAFLKADNRPEAFANLFAILRALAPLNNFDAVTVLFRVLRRWDAVSSS